MRRIHLPNSLLVPTRRRQQALPHCQAEALQNDQVFRPPPMLRDESSHASQEPAPQSVRPKRTPFLVGGSRCRSCMDSVSNCMVENPCSNTVHPPRRDEPLGLVQTQFNLFCLRATAESLIQSLALRRDYAPDSCEASRNGQPLLIWTVLFPRFFTPD